MLDLRFANQNRFAHAKRLWTIANSLRLTMFVVGAWAIFLAKPPVYLPHFLFIIVVAAELFQWRSDITKSQCESLLRKLDFCRSFNVVISPADKREIISYLPKSLRRQFGDAQMPDHYFTSSAPPGARTAVENLVESAWYTRQQAKMMVSVCFFLAVLFVGIALAALIFTSIGVENASTRANVAKVATSWLLLIVSLGIFKHGWGYYKLAERCDRSYSTGEHLLGGDVTEADAIKQWYEYQIGRASSPLLPEWLWNLRQDDLNDAWERASGT